MKKLLITIAVIALGASTAHAIPLGANITIPDLMSSGAKPWWGPQEDQEVEPGCVLGQVWDMEGFFLAGSTLTVVSGYDLSDGGGGDIFIDVTGDVVYGPAADGTGSGFAVVPNSFGYDYVLDLDFANSTYDVLALTGNSLVETVQLANNQESNPYRYDSGGLALTSYQGVPMTYWTGLLDADVAGLLGGNHNALVVDLSFLADGTDFTSHQTLFCGNDNLMGRARIPDGGETALLLGCAVIGLEIIRRKLLRRRA